MKDFINKDMDISLAEKFNIGPGQYSNISVTELPFSIRVINRFRGNGIQTVGDMLSRTENELSKFRGFGANCLKEIEAYCIHLSQENDDSIAHSSFNMKPRVHALVSNNLMRRRPPKRSVPCGNQKQTTANAFLLLCLTVI